MDSDRAIWSGMLSHLRGTHPTLCRQWFEELEPSGLGSGVLRLRARTDVHKDYLQRQCLDHFNDAARAVTGRLLSVRFTSPADDDAHANAHANAQRQHPAALDPEPIQHPAVQPLTTAAPPVLTPPVSPSTDGSLVINPDYAFDSFVVGPANRMAHAAALAVGNKPGRSYNPFFVHGKVGLGKTHLLQAVCLKIREHHPAARIYYTSCEGFSTQFIDAVQAGQMNHFRHKFRDIDVLVIDDIHFLAKRDRTQEEFFHTFNALYQANKQIVLSSDAPPDEIPDLEERLVSRFNWGLVVQVGPPCYETRVEILKTKARLRGLPLPDDVACYIAARIDTNIRELEGAITKCQVQSMVEKRPIDLDLAKAALGDSTPKSPSEITIQAITTAVVDHFGVRLSELLSKRRQRSIAVPRQVCMYLARRLTRCSLEEIGLNFGGRDHTTVMHAVRIIEVKLAQDATFAAGVKSLEERLAGKP